MSKHDKQDYTIESDVPPPEVSTDYPWPDMQSNDSVVVPEAAASSARSFVAKHRPGWRVQQSSKAQYLDGAGEGHVRVWFRETPGEEASEAPEE